MALFLQTLVRDTRDLYRQKVIPDNMVLLRREVVPDNKVLYLPEQILVKMDSFQLEVTVTQTVVLAISAKRRRCGGIATFLLINGAGHSALPEIVPLNTAWTVVG